MEHLPWDWHCQALKNKGGKDNIDKDGICEAVDLLSLEKIEGKNRKYTAVFQIKQQEACTWLIMWPEMV